MFLVFIGVVVCKSPYLFKMPCSAVTLSLATITSIIAVALLAIAFATDNWLYIEVKRTNIQVRSDFRISANAFRKRGILSNYVKVIIGAARI